MRIRREKKPEVYECGAVTFENSNLVRNFYKPAKLWEFLSAFFMYYNMPLGGETAPKHITIRFYTKKRSMWLNVKLATIGLKGFILRASLVTLVFFSYIVSYQVDSGYLGAVPSEQLFSEITQIILVSFALSCILVMDFLLLQKILRRWSKISGLARTVTGEGQHGFIDMYDVNNMTRQWFLNVFFHELDHVLWAFEKKPFDNEEYYEERPHEIRARARGEGWAAAALAPVPSETNRPVNMVDQLTPFLNI